MYQIGEKVVYGIHGVCMVVEQEVRVVDHKQVIYLVLEPMGQDGSRYFVPTSNEAAMAKLRRMLSKAELEELMKSPQIHTDCWIKDENMRKQRYRELISSGDRVRLMQMVYTLYCHKTVQAAAGRKCHLCDENFLRDAEKRLVGEVAQVMGMDNDTAKKYIRDKLKEGV